MGFIGTCVHSLRNPYQLRKFKLKTSWDNPVLPSKDISMLGALSIPGLANQKTHPKKPKETKKDRLKKRSIRRFFRGFHTIDYFTKFYDLLS